MNSNYIDIHTHAEGAVLTSVGIHPWDAENHTLALPEVKRAFEAEVAEAEVVGEIGLDFAAEVDREAQRELFVTQLKIAKKHRKVVVLHCVKAFEPTMQILATFPLKVIFHGFIGSAQQMNQAVERGYYISFGERVFSSPKTLKAMRECPLERLFIESDTSQTPIEEIYSKVAKQRIETLEELRDGIAHNFRTLFPTHSL